MSSPTLFDWLRLIASIATPITLAGIGYWLNQRLKSIDNAQWQNRKIIEKRLDLFDFVAPRLNSLYCFVAGVGDWKDISPKKLLETKRELDKYVNVYRHLLSEEFYAEYNEYVHSIFLTFSGKGNDARIKAKIVERWGDRRRHANYDWDKSFDELFLEDAAIAREEAQKRYLSATSALRDCLGIVE